MLSIKNLLKKQNIKFLSKTKTSLQNNHLKYFSTEQEKEKTQTNEENIKSETSGEIDIDLLKMREFNEHEEYNKVIDLYNTIPFTERNKLHKMELNKASLELKKLFDEVNNLYETRRTRGIIYKLLLFGGLTLGLFYLYKHSFHNEQKTESSSSFISKMMDPTHHFEISFAKDNKERLDNVKGINEVKEEIEQLIAMIKEPQAYLDAGAKLHKGILLCGKPGTGKTLIARAIAGEAGVNFIFITGSDFDEMFVGVGAARIRKLFKKAKESAPCIIFIDEIDSLLTKSRRSGEHSSSRGTLNQFLAEMDGFSKLDQVYVIGATNHEKDLDPAAVRPGRFDKTIHINYPDEDGRIEIINFYLERIKMKKAELDSKYLARLTPGFSGAEIENLINLSILHALNLEKEQVDMEDFFEARDRILMGIPRKKFTTSEKNRYHTSLHEAGHTIVCYKNPICKKNLHLVTIIPRGQALGVTAQLANEEALHTKNEFIAHIDTAMGGHVAEELIYGNDHVTAGCSSDLEKATKIAQSMVKNYGMYGSKVGYIYVEDQGYSFEEDVVSDRYKTRIDEVVKEILKVKFLI